LGSSVVANGELVSLARILGDRFHRPRVSALRRRADELAEQRLGPGGAGLELGVELGGDEEGVIGELDHLNQALVGRGAA
jgi:hypothetical protein